MTIIGSDQVFDALEAIAYQSGHGKLALLKQHPEVQPYLVAAYDPYQRYYMTTRVTGQGTYEFEPATWEMLDFLHKRALSGSHGQKMLDSAVMGMTTKSAELFKRILKKDLRIGLAAKSINKVFPGLIPTHDVMRAKLLDIARLTFPCFGSIKKDGVRSIFKNGKFYSRNGHVYPGLKVLEDQLSLITTPLDGELTVPGETFQVGSGMIRRGVLTPNAQFSLFELPTITDPFIERIMLMKDMHLFGPNVVTIDQIKLNNIDEVFDFYKACRAAGHEGSIIRPYDYEYVGTRSYRWMKMKNIIDLDLKVKDIYEGKGKYKGMLGGVIVEYKYPKEKVPTKFNVSGQKVGGGFSDREREIWYAHPGLILGKTIHTVITEFTDDGNFRHARMGKEKIRFDKEAS